MQRRDFIHKAGLAGMGLLAAGSFALSCSANKEFEWKNWVWITPEDNLSIQDWIKRFDFLKENNIHGAIIQIYGSHKTLYESKHLPVHNHLLEKLIAIGQTAGVEVHAWMWTMPNNNPFYIENHPEFYAVNGLGQPSYSHPAYVGYYKFMCPNQPGVRDFLQRNVSELAAKEGLSGVHFDYIRLPDVIIAEALQPVYNITQDREYPEYDYCYCEVCREKFKSQTGIDPLNDLEDPSANEQWRQFRYNSVTELVNTVLIPEVKSQSLQATAAVFPNWESVRQQWSQWDMDAYFPMLYHNFYNAPLSWIGSNLEKQISELKRKVPIYSGLYIPSLSPDELSEAISISRQSGASGISVFSHNALKSEHWEALL